MDYINGRFWITMQQLVDILNAVASLPIAVLFAAQLDFSTAFRLWRMNKACKQVEGVS